MKKTVLTMSIVMLALVSLQGCETMKAAGCGAKKDLANTGENVGQGFNALLEMDRKFQEKYW